MARIFLRGSGGGFAAPTFLCPKEKSPRPVEKKCFCFGVWAWITNGRAKASLRSRPLGRWARGFVVLSVAPAPSTAPIAARPVQRLLSETTAPSTATLRQQGVDKSLIVLGAALVDISIIVHQSRAARHKPPIPSKSPANSTPAFAGRWDRKRPISPAEIFSSTVHGAFFLIFQKEWGVHSCGKVP